VTSPANEQPIDADHGDDGKQPKRIKLDKFFQAMITADGSDLHLKEGAPLHIRIHSVLHTTKSEALKADEIAEMAYELLDERQRARFAETGAIDLAYEWEDTDRFRINIYRQRGNVSIAVRRVTREIPDFESLHLPPGIRTVAESHQGLILLSGPTGSGKSTTIAAMLEYINQTRACHIVSIEDPIEYLYTDKKALIDQREIGIDAADFPSALRSLMREDPDVVLIGEMRDRETFEAALQAAETGHQVFGSVHASTAPGTISRILEMFPATGRDLARHSLASNLTAIICQRLLPGVSKKLPRVPAVEMLLSNATVRKLIQDGRDNDLVEVIRSHEQHGMQSFTRSLMGLIEKDYIDPKVAYDVATNAEELKMLMKGISSSQAGLVTRR